MAKKKEIVSEIKDAGENAIFKRQRA